MRIQSWRGTSWDRWFLSRDWCRSNLTGWYWRPAGWHRTHPQYCSAEHPKQHVHGERLKTKATQSQLPSINRFWVFNISSIKVKYSILTSWTTWRKIENKKATQSQIQWIYKFWVFNILKWNILYLHYLHQWLIFCRCWSPGWYSRGLWWCKARWQRWEDSHSWSCWYWRGPRQFVIGRLCQRQSPVTVGQRKQMIRKHVHIGSTTYACNTYNFEN